MARRLWLACVGLLVIAVLLPVGTGATRFATVCLLGVVWLGALVWSWRRPVVRWTALAVTVASVTFLVGPARGRPHVGVLRDDYVAALRGYDGVTYVWGGENARGIDCAGLVRRGLVDALAWRGVRTADPGLVREAIDLWWHDRSARALGNGAGVTAHVADARSIDEVDPAAVLPGDLAVTRDGLHVLAYLGAGEWVAADPEMGRVVAMAAPSPDNPWFHVPVRIVRWAALDDGEPRS